MISYLFCFLVGSFFQPQNTLNFNHRLSCLGNLRLLVPPIFQNSRLSNRYIQPPTTNHQPPITNPTTFPERNSLKR